MRFFLYIGWLVHNSLLVFQPFPKINAWNWVSEHAIRAFPNACAYMDASVFPIIHKSMVTIFFLEDDKKMSSTIACSHNPYFSTTSSSFFALLIPVSVAVLFFVPFFWTFNSTFFLFFRWVVLHRILANPNCCSRRRNIANDKRASLQKIIVFAFYLRAVRVYTLCAYLFHR